MGACNCKESKIFSIKLIENELVNATADVKVPDSVENSNLERITILKPTVRKNSSVRIVLNFR